MGKRGRPRKNPTLENKKTIDTDQNSIPQNLDEDDISKDYAQNDPTEVMAESADESTDEPTDSLPEGMPKEWVDIKIPKLVAKGWTYRTKTDKRGNKYMHIRNRTNERSLGAWSSEREALLFELFPKLYKPKGSVETEKEAAARSPGGGLGRKPFFNVPIRRVAVVPGDYHPSMDVIRYYHIYKNNGFLGDFSDFLNGIVSTHFVKCHGIVLPVYVNEELIVPNA